MSTHNICFFSAIREIFMWIPHLSRGMKLKTSALEMAW